MISTQAGIQLGHIYDGHMVNVQANNLKLRQRTNKMVMQSRAAMKCTLKTPLL